MFEERGIRVLAYNLETFLAEKFIAVLSFDVINSRMKDFYDIHMIINDQSYSVSPGIFKEALNNTAKQRNMLHLIPQSAQIIETIAGNQAMADLWKRYCAAYRYAADIEFDIVIKTFYRLSEWSTTKS